MKRKDITTGRKTAQDKGITVFQEGVEISHKQEAVKEGTTVIGWVYLVIDCSGSMSGQKIEQAKKGAIDFTQKAREKGYLVGLIQFDSSARYLCQPQSEISILKEYVGRITIGSSTNMADGIRLATEMLLNKKGLRAMVIVTDGMPTDGEPTPEEATLREAKKAKENKIDIIIIGTDDADWRFLKKIATRADLATYVTQEKLALAITSAAQFLPEPRKRTKS